LLIAAGAKAADAVPTVTTVAKNGGALPPDSNATAVFADVHWVGLCDDRRALEREMRKRGARLHQAGVASPSTGTDRFKVDVQVRLSSDEHGYAARVSISSETGAHDVREVEAGKCEQLHSVVAWVLVVLARGPRLLDETNRVSDAATESANGLSRSVPAAGAASQPASAPSDPRTKLQSFGSVVTLLGYGRVVPRAQPTFSLGAQLMGGWLFLRQPAWGPTVFFEHRPLRCRPLALRLSLLRLANDTSISDSNIAIAVTRTAARFAGSIKVPSMPVALMSGLEAGLLAARGSGSLVSHLSRRVWAAWSLGIVLEVPILRERLWLTAGADAALCPLTYAFRTTSERTIIESGPVELRAAAGLKSSF
jgi:hypothetical protein